MKRKWLTKSVAVIAMALLLAGCGNTVNDTDISVQSDGGVIQDTAEESATEGEEEQNTISVTEIESEVTELLHRVLFHHPEDTNPEDDEVLYEYEYDKAGRLLRESNYNTKSCTVYEYDASDRLVKSEEYFKDDLSYWLEYEYDALGFLAQKNSYGLDGSISCYIEYENDSSGNVLKEVQYENDGSISVRVEYAYDEPGKLIEKTCYNEASVHGNNENRFEYVYDASDNLLRETWYLNDELRGYTEYIYDLDGNLLKEEVHYIFSFNGEDILDHYFEYTYDESGALLTQVMYERDGNVFYDTVNEQFVNCFRYEYCQ